MGEPTFERDERGGVTVVVDGHPQSHVDPRDPGVLAFEYVRIIADVVATLPPGPLAVTHVGGAGLTLARWIQHERPGSPQIVLEPDAALTDAVRRELPLPRGHRIRVRPVPGREGVAALRDASADVVVVDAYAAGRVPADLLTVEFLRDVRRVLRPDGVVLLNVADEPGLRFVARVVAGAGAAFGSGSGHGTGLGAGSGSGFGSGFGEPSRVGLVATHEVLKGRRFGNTVVVGSAAGLDADEISRRAARSPFPTGVRAGAALSRLVAGARPLTDADGIPSPPAPDPGSWRVH